MSDSLQPHELQHARLSCPSPRACSNSCPSSWSCHPIISSSVVPFSSCLQSFPASGSLPMSQFLTSGGQSIGVLALASIFPINNQDWFPLGLTGWISLLSKGLSRVFSNSVVYLWSNQRRDSWWWDMLSSAVWEPGISWCRYQLWCRKSTKNQNRFWHHLSPSFRELWSQICPNATPIFELGFLLQS